MRCAVFVSLVLLFPFLQPAHAQDPVFITGFRIQDGGADLQVSYAGAPAAVDWNNDGTKDLVVGQETYGNIRLYLNQGTNLNPVFDGYGLIESNGQPITMTWT